MPDTSAPISRPSQVSPATLRLRSAQKALDRSIKFWFAATVLGQLLFLIFILAFYYPSTLTGHYSEWNTKPLIKGFVAGDFAGNLAFASHVLLAAVITGSGLVQLIPVIRRRWPAVHRWNGRIYLVTALLLAAGGLGCAGRT